MAEYTPTTAEIRSTYAVSLEEFDRWKAWYRNAIILEVHDEVRMIPCYGKNGQMEFDIGRFARTQVLDVIGGMQTDA